MSTAPPPQTGQCSFEQLQLHIGDRLQLELLGDNTNNRYYTVLVGYAPGHSILLRTPLVQSLPIPVREGEPIRVRTFSGRYACNFESTVTRACRTPFPYLHISYPQVVQQTLIRGALRVRVKLTGTALNPERQGDADQALPVSIADLSTTGVLVESAGGLGEPGEKVELAFKFLVQPNDYEVKLAVSTRIQSKRKDPRPAADGVHVHGLRFSGLRNTEVLLLQSYIQQILLEDRSRIV